MKKLSLILLGLSPLCLIGCNGNGSSVEKGPASIDYAAMANIGDFYKLTLDIVGDMPLGEGLPTTTVTSSSVSEKNGKICYENSNYSSTLIGTKAEAAKYLSKEFERTVTEENVLSTLDSLKGRRIKDYTVEGDTVTVDMGGYFHEAYYDYTNSDMLPVCWEKETDEESPQFDKWVGTTSVYNHYSLGFDEDIFKHASEFAYDPKTGTLTISQDQALSLDLIDEDSTLEKYEIHINADSKITSMEEVILVEGGKQTATATFEYASNLALPAESERAPLCSHAHLYDYYSHVEIDGDNYHFEICEDCDSHLHLEKCSYDDQGFCTVCGDELRKRIMLVGDEFHEPVVYVEVNAVTNKIIDVSITDYPSALDDQHDDLDIYSDYLFFDRFSCSVTDEYVVSYALAIEYEGVNYMVVKACFSDTYEDIFFLIKGCSWTDDYQPTDWGSELVLEVTVEGTSSTYVPGDVYNGEGN